MGTTVYSAAALVAESAEHDSGGIVWWGAVLLTFGAIALLALTLALMTKWERKRHPHG